VHEGDIGVLLRLTVMQDGAVKNVSTASVKQIVVYKPSGEEVTRTASFTTDGTDGKVQCATEDGDLDEIGRYHYCAYLVIGSWSGHTAGTTFDVKAVGQ
jgi:hypothetical protein